MSKNYNLTNIYKNIFTTFITSKAYDNKTKQNIINLFSNYKNNNFKNIIHIESLLINIMNTII